MPIPVDEFEEKGRKREAKNQIKSVLTKNPARVSEITEKVERSQSTVSKYLKEFKKIGVVSKDEENKYHLNQLKKDEERILENIIKKNLSTEKEISKALNLNINLRIKLKKLIELRYLSGSPKSFSVRDKALSKFDRTLSGEKINNQMVYHTEKSDGFTTFQSKKDPILDSPKHFLSYFQSAAGIEICNHCGFPLDPDYIRKIVLTDPENGEDSEEAQRERCEELIRELYGPVGSLLQMFKTYQEGEFKTTDKHYNTYRKNGKKYHPYCRKTIEKL